MRKTLTEKSRIENNNSKVKQTNRRRNKRMFFFWLPQCIVCGSSFSSVFHLFCVSYEEAVSGCVQVSNALLILYVQTPHYSASTSRNPPSATTKKKRKMFAGFSLINRKVEKKFSMVVVDRRQREKR